MFWRDNLNTRLATCHPNKKDHGGGLCANCHSAKYRSENPERVRAWTKKRYYKNRLQRLRHTISQSEYIEMIQEQAGCCGICKKPFEGNPHIDHDHKTGIIRGLLCFNCNAGLGLFKDSPQLLLNAAEYLSKLVEEADSGKSRTIGLTAATGVGTHPAEGKHATV